MDQFVCCCGEQDHAVMIDCRSLEYTLAPIPPTVRIVICNSMVSTRSPKASTTAAARRLKLGTDMLQAPARNHGAARRHHGRPRPVGQRDVRQVLKRCRHVITENARVLAAADAFRVSNLTHFGELMRQAHISFRDDFEASCKEIDILV